MLNPDAKIIKKFTKFYFNASYSDYCPGIEWDENEKE